MGHKGIWAKLTDTAASALRSRDLKETTPDQAEPGKQNTTTNTIGPHNAGTAVQAHTIHGGIGNTTHITNTTTVQPQRALLLALDSVPAPPDGFVGRGDELAAVCARLKPANDKDDNAPSSGAVVVSALAGMGGVGKTALALKAAQIASDANWFCAHLFVDLHSYTPHTPPLAATGALDVLLRQMGIDPADIPPGLDERSAFYRSALQALTRADQQGRPALVVADNAHHLDQIRPLLPGPGAHRLLVTSRQTLAIDGHQPLTLDALPPDQAVELLQARLGPNDPRRTHKDELQTLAQRCGYLPLALKIAAALLARPPHLTPGRLAHRLAELSTFSDGEHDLTAVFTASLEHLPTNQVRIFALLGANPGTDISTTAAAFMVGAQNPEQAETVERALEELATAHLITSPGPDRWAMHDLVAQHARTLNPPPATKNKPGWKKTRTKWKKRLDEGDEGDLALDRILHLYMTMAEAANDHLRTRKSNIPLEVFPDREAALTWLDTEIDNLLACVRTAHHTHRAQTAMHLPTFLGTYLNLRRRFDDAIEAHTLACQSAQQAGAIQHEAGAWNNLGSALLEVRRFDEAIDALTHALETFQQAGDAHGEASAWNNLGVALREVRRFDEAIDALTHARDIHHQNGDTHNEAQAWNNLGNALKHARRFDEAIDALTHARDLHQQTGDAHGEAGACNNLGSALQQVRRFDEAIASHTHALETFQQAGDAHGEASAWNNLGSALQQVRRFDEAIASHTHAQEMYQQTGDAHGEAGACNNLGLAWWEVHRFDKAIASYTRAQKLYQQTSDAHSQAGVWNNLSLALQQVRRFDEAIASYTRAQKLYHQTEDPHSEASVWNNLGNAQTQIGRFDEAIEAYKHVLDHCQHLRDVHGEAQTWCRIGAALGYAGRINGAIQTFTRALALFEADGDEPCATHARETITQLQHILGSDSTT